MSLAIFIPARLGASRLPHKPLALLDGKPLIWHVWRRATLMNIAPVFVATDSQKVARVIQKEGGQAVLTPAMLPSGSDRVWYALQHIDPDGTYKTIINLQGDMAIFPQDILKAAIENLPQNPTFPITTFVKPLDDKDWDNPSAVKVCTRKTLYGPQATTFRRTLDAPTQNGLHHIGVYIYKRHALKMFVTAPPSADEEREKLEQLRAFSIGLSIGVVKIPPSTWVSIDTPEDLKKAGSVLAADKNTAQPKQA